MRVLARTKMAPIVAVPGDRMILSNTRTVTCYGLSAEQVTTWWARVALGRPVTTAGCGRTDAHGRHIVYENTTEVLNAVIDESYIFEEAVVYAATAGELEPDAGRALVGAFIEKRRDGGT